MKKRKILFLIHELNYSGAAKILAFIANNLSSAGHEVIVHAYNGISAFYELNKDIRYIPAHKVYNNGLSKLKCFYCIRKTIMDVKPELIVSFLPNSNMFAIVGSAFLNIPVIICERSDPYNERGILLSLKRSLYRYANGAVFQTEGAKKYYPEALQRKSIVIPNPVTTDKAERIPISRRNNEIAFAARFYIRQKRQDIMLMAFKTVAEKNKDVTLAFYGDGPDMQAIKDMARQLGISDRVSFKGKVKNIPDVLKYSRMFVLTSDYEGIPNVLIEAMAAGLPVVSTDCSPGGARLLIENKINGLLVPVRDVEKLSGAIMSILDDPQTGEKYGTEAQKIVDRFAPYKIIDCWQKYIDEVAEHGKSINNRR